MRLHEAFLSSSLSSDPREACYLAGSSMGQVGSTFLRRLWSTGRRWLSMETNSGCGGREPPFEPGTKHMGVQPRNRGEFCARDTVVAKIVETRVQSSGYPRLAPQGLYLRNILVQPLGKHPQQLTPVRVPENEGGREPQHRSKERVDDIVCARLSAHAQHGGHLLVEQPVNLAEILNASIKASHDRGSPPVVVRGGVALGGREGFASYSAKAQAGRF